MSKKITDKMGPPDKGFVSGVIAELKKVTWPTKNETIRLTGIVILISLIIGAYIGIIDVFMAKALKILTGIN